MKYLTKHTLVVALLILSITAKATNSPITIESFTNLPASRDVQISPDGQYLSIVMRKDGEDLLAILERDSLKTKSVFRVQGARKSVGKVNWINNKRLVYSVTESTSWNKTRVDNGELIGVNVDGSKHRIIFGYRSEQAQTGTRLNNEKATYGNHKIVDLMQNDDNNILLAFYPWYDDGRYWRPNPDIKPTLYQLNVFTGKKRRMGSLPLPFADALVDKNGEVRIASGVDKNDQFHIYHKPAKADTWQELNFKQFEGKNIYPLSFAKDNESLYLLANVGDGSKALYNYNIGTEKMEKLYHDEKVNIYTFVRDFTGNHIVAVATDYGLPQYYYLDKNNFKADLHNKLMQSFKHSDVAITSTTKDETLAIVYVYSDKNPGDYYLFETSNLKAEYLLSRHPQIEAKMMATTDSFTFKARDGKTIQAYLTTPDNPNNEKLPLVVFPHGGPHGVRDYWGYDWEVQLMASRGYAVLQVNYRGSGGFGSSFEQAGYGNWGTSMQDDLTDGTKNLIEKGLVDAQRICIYGASYGGYAALTGAFREPDLYQCAIGSMGVYDLPMMFVKGDIPENEHGLNYLNKVLGDDVNEQKQRSPAYNADKIKANILLIHGVQDERVPIAQAQVLMQALDKAGKKYQWLKLNDEAHGYYDEQNRLTIYTKILEFLAQNIGKKSL